jgi:hypothetical protein
MKIKYSQELGALPTDKLTLEGTKDVLDRLSVEVLKNQRIIKEMKDSYADELASLSRESDKDTKVLLDNLQETVYSNQKFIGILKARYKDEL